MVVVARWRWRWWAEGFACCLHMLGSSLPSPLLAWGEALRAVVTSPSPPHTLAAFWQVAAGEAVHEVGSWRDLKGRLDPATRRVYGACWALGALRAGAGTLLLGGGRYARRGLGTARQGCGRTGGSSGQLNLYLPPSFLPCSPAFFHEAMPGEPLVVLHTALTSGVASTMAQLLPSAAQTAVAAAAGHPHLSAAEAAAHGYDRTWEHEQQLPVLPFLHVREPQAPTTAVFYSISATQRGLSGVDLGNFLIKQVGGLGATWRRHLAVVVGGGVVCSSCRPYY